MWRRNEMASALFFLMFCNLVIAEVNGNETIDTLEFKDENLVSKPKMDETHLETIRNVDAAKVDGQWTVWGAWSSCTKTCGGGTSTRKRTCSNPAPNGGGRPCVGSAIREGKCNTMRCKACLDNDGNSCVGCLGKDGICNRKTWRQCRKDTRATWCGAGHCSPELWLGYDKMTCGPCAALVKIKYYGKTCTEFCAAQKMSCVMAWDDRRNEKCSHFAREFSCGYTWARTSDAICHCSPVARHPTNPFVIMPPKQKCKGGKEITTAERCKEADDWARSLGLHPRRPPYKGHWKEVPHRCSAQIGGDNTIHFSTNSQTNNKRFLSGEFAMICEKGVQTYHHFSKACLYQGGRLGQYADKSLDECKNLCNKRDNCMAFEYGVDYGGSEGRKPRDCVLSNHIYGGDCDGGYWNLDLYVKFDASPHWYTGKNRNCPLDTIITTEKVCREAAAGLGFIFKETIAEDHTKPSGCYGYLASRTTYFNTKIDAASTVPTDDSRGICVADK